MVEIDSVVGMSILQSVKKQFGVTGANFDLNYLSYFWINFQNSCGYHVANFLDCWIQVRISYVCAPEPEKLAKTKSSVTYGTPCIYLSIYLSNLSIYIFIYRVSKKKSVLSNQLEKPTGPYLTLSDLTGPYWALLGLTGPYWALLAYLLNLYTH